MVGPDSGIVTLIVCQPTLILKANRFVCNAIPANNTVIFPSGCDETAGKLRALGYKTKEVDMSEFMKSGGACQCLVLKLPD